MRVQVTRFGNFSCWFETDRTRMDKKTYIVFKIHKLLILFPMIPFKLAQNLVLQCSACIQLIHKRNNNQLKHKALANIWYISSFSCLIIVPMWTWLSTNSCENKYEDQNLWKKKMVQCSDCSLYSRVPNRSPCAFISGKVCLLTLIEPKRQTLPEINAQGLLFGTLE